MVRSGKIFLIVFICILILITAVLPVFAESSSPIVEENDFENPSMKEYIWVYILIAVFTVFGIITSAVYITKKIK